MATTRVASKRTAATQSGNGHHANGSPPTSGVAFTAPDEATLTEFLRVLRAAKDGDFSVRLPERRNTLMGQIGAAFNDLVEMNAKSTKELARIGKLVGREGRMGERFSIPDARGGWAEKAASVN